MPALPDQPNTLRIDLKFTYANDLDVLVRQFFTYTGTAPTNANLDTFAASVAGLVDSELKTLFHSTVALVETTVTDLSSSTAGRGTSSTGVTGTLSGAVNGAQVAFLQGNLIDRRYRGGKPRTYWPFGDQSVLEDPQHWTSGFVTDVATGVGGYTNGVLALTWAGATMVDNVNVSYYAGFVPVAGSTGRVKNVSQVRGTAHSTEPVIAPDPVTGSTFSNILATQRRRTTRKR